MRRWTASQGPSGLVETTIECCSMDACVRKSRYEDIYPQINNDIHEPHHNDWTTNLTGAPDRSIRASPQNRRLPYYMLPSHHHWHA